MAGNKGNPTADLDKLTFSVLLQVSSGAEANQRSGRLPTPSGPTDLFYNFMSYAAKQKNELVYFPLCG